MLFDYVILYYNVYVPHNVYGVILIWVVVKIMVRFWVPNIVRHLIFRVPKQGTLILTTTHIEGGTDSHYSDSPNPKP